MKPTDRQLWLDTIAGLYLEALTAEDYATQDKLWALAKTEHDLVPLFDTLHEEFLAERKAQAREVLAQAVEQHLGAQVITAAGGPLTVADVANHLVHAPAERWPAEAHGLNEKLRSCREAVPAELGLKNLVKWAEEKFGTAPAAYWKAFYDAVVKLELQRDTEYQLAARKAKKE